MSTRPKARRTGRPPGHTPRREMLIDAAVDLFHKEGFRHASTADVGAAAGISGPAVYRHFANKEELLHAVLEVSAEAMADAAEEAVALPPEAALDCLLERFASLNVFRPGWLVLWLEERRNLSPAVRDHIGKLHQDHIATWADTVRRVRPELSAHEAHVLAQTAIGVMTSVTYLHLDPRHPDQVAGEGLQRMLVGVARRAVLETPLADVRASLATVS